ncbi:hypothetical protein SHIRM173S_11241 [Streptomyces hirsutus]
MTGGVHLGASRNYFAVHVDDVLAADDRWDTELNCTPGDVDCPEGEGTPDPIRMLPADVDHATSWQSDQTYQSRWSVPTAWWWVIVRQAARIASLAACLAHIPCARVAVALGRAPR